MLRSLPPITLAVALVACDPPTRPLESGPAGASPSLASQSTSHFTIREQLSDIIESPCTGEVLPFTAARFEETNVVEQGDVLHFEVTESISGSGTAEGTGTRYLVHDVSHFSFQTPNLTSPQVSLFDMPHTIKLISQAGGQNFLEHVVFHLVRLPSGEVKTTVEFDKAECRR
jgi:hypothetical protein